MISNNKRMIEFNQILLEVLFAAYLMVLGLWIDDAMFWAGWFFLVITYRNAHTLGKKYRDKGVGRENS